MKGSNSLFLSNVDQTEQLKHVDYLNTKIHPSILILLSRGEPGVYPRKLGAQGLVHRGQDAGLLQGGITHTLTHYGHFRDAAHVFLPGRKPEYLKVTPVPGENVQTGGNQTPHLEV